MSHYEIEYVGDQADCDARALTDIQNYIGRDRYITLTEACRNHAPEFILGCLGMCGIQGYPVYAFFRRYLPDHVTLLDQDI